MGFMIGKSSAEPSLKLHLLRLEMQPLYQDVKICDLVIFQFFSMIYILYWQPLLSRCRPKILRSLLIVATTVLRFKRRSSGSNFHEVVLIKC